MIYLRGGGMWHLSELSWRMPETYCSRVSGRSWPIGVDPTDELIQERDVSFQMPLDLDQTPVCTFCTRAWSGASWRT